MLPDPNATRTIFFADASNISPDIPVQIDIWDASVDLDAVADHLKIDRDMLGTREAGSGYIVVVPRQPDDPIVLLQGYADETLSRWTLPADTTVTFGGTPLPLHALGPQAAIDLINYIEDQIINKAYTLEPIN